MPAFIDKTGRKIGRLRVIRRVACKGTVWLCRCQCGKLKKVSGSNLGVCIFSCGCLSRDNFIKRLTKHGNAKNRTDEYESWKNMRSRCNNPKHPRFSSYGGRGISVCKRWNSFSNFLADMGPRPSKSHTIERLNNSKGYYPGNCIWGTRKQQARNKRNVPLIEYEGQSRCLAEWVEKLGLCRQTVYKRLKRGMTIKDAFEVPT